ncbi:prepilin-type N-terminal cleavage/methylation domain-containing protein [Shewanella sp. NFH-SH190041]|uniref:type IV pilus modification PilV family protein n=1 Tax=Shewanella sp. NFH-SH190041 TaxID=2950245 RepID=UPI003965A321
MADVSVNGSRKFQFLPSTRSRVSFNQGFTLIELVIGMLVLGIALVMLATMLYPQADRAADSLYRVRSAELGQSVMNEIWGKRFDENTDANGGAPCGPAPLPSCSLNLGSDTGETRNDWDDVDDFNGMTQTSKILDSDRTYADLYPGYQLNVTVAAGPDGKDISKLITISVTTPLGEDIVFNALRSNF